MSESVPSTPQSIEQWESEILSALRGERAYSLQHMGSLEGHFEALILKTPNEDAARDAFRRAVRAIVQMWQPSHPAEAQLAAGVLEIVGAYTPPEGIQKVVEFLSLAPIPQQRAGLRRRAFETLSRYYSVPPAHPVSDASFEVYLRILNDELRAGSERGVAARALLSLGQLQVDSEVIHYLICEDPPSAREVLMAILLEHSMERLAIGLGFLYVVLLALGRSQDFISWLQDEGWGFEDGRDGPLVVSNDGERIQLIIAAVDLYMSLRHERTRLMRVTHRLRDEALA